MKLRSTYKWFAIASFSLMTAAATFYLAGVRVNTTGSIPLGLYKTVSGEVKKGDYVIFCPADTATFSEARERSYISSGLCDGGLGLMMKKILAAKNDVVSVSQLGVFINGEKLANSEPLKMDKSGRELIAYQANNLTLNEEQVLLMSDISATSFDARYFGLIDKSQIKSKIRPLINW